MRIIEEDIAGPEPTFPPGFEPSAYAEATAVSPADGSGITYIVDIKRDWCIGLGTYDSLVSINTNYYVHKKSPMEDISCPSSLRLSATTFKTDILP
jgi:hypothetical protein